MSGLGYRTKISKKRISRCLDVYIFKRIYCKKLDYAIERWLHKFKTHTPTKQWGA